jgi:hypothetical protein
MVSKMQQIESNPDFSFLRNNVNRKVKEFSLLFKGNKTKAF